MTGISSDLNYLRENLQVLDYEMKDERLDRLIKYVLKRVPDKYKEDFPFHSVYEGPFSSGAYVTEDYVMFDPKTLAKLSSGDDDVIIGIIAHEFAHVFLRRGICGSDERPSLKMEDDADQLASDWGFASQVKAFRQKTGRATL